jgi:hypothetical protein
MLRIIADVLFHFLMKKSFFRNFVIALMIGLMLIRVLLLVYNSLN